tara:strand:- start:202 stop:579 length:378 start_codon:yes stop_codon:yes gene_type:complete
MTVFICMLMFALIEAQLIWLHLRIGALEYASIPEPTSEKEPNGSPYREPGAQPPNIPVDTPTVAQAEPPKRIIPELAQEYLDAEKKLIKKARGQDMKGMSMIGDMTRDEARNCRNKAEKLIREAN